MSSVVRPAPLLTRMNQEWECVYAARGHEFGALGVYGCGSLLDRVRRASGSAQDALLYELVALAHAGDRVAERLLIQVLIPAAQRMAHRVTRLEDLDRADRVGFAIGAAFESIRRYRLHLHRRVHANLTMGMLAVLAPARTANDRVILDHTTTAAPDVLESVSGAWTPPEEPVEVRLANLFTWAVDTSVLTRDEVALLARASLGERKHADVAEEMGVSLACLRKRVDRIRGRLAAAVQERYI